MQDTPPQTLVDAHLLLRDFIASRWRSLSVASGALHLSVSRLSLAEREAAVTSSPRPQQAGAPTTILRAPHVATLRSVASAGTTIPSGGVYATIEVLDDVKDLSTQEDITIIAALANAGGFLEFDTPIVEIG